MKPLPPAVASTVVCTVACAVALALAPLATPTLAAQDAAGARSRSTGLFLAAGVNGSAINSDDLTDGTESGGGIDLRLGYGFARGLALLLGLTGAAIDGEQDTYGLGHVELGLRYSFANAQRVLIPYLEVAGTVRALVQEDVELIDPNTGNPIRDDLTISGGGLTLGGGVQYFVAPAWALSADLRWTGGEFSEVEYGNVTVEGFEFDATTTRLSLGVTWFPMRPREAR